MELKDFCLAFGIAKSNRFKKGDVISSEANDGHFHIGIYEDEAPNEGLCYILAENAVYWDTHNNRIEKSEVSRFGKYRTRLANEMEVAVYNNFRP